MKRRQFSNGNEVVDFGITKNSVNVYICLNSHLAKRNGIYPGTGTIAKECGISDQAVKESIQQLERIGFITTRPIE